MKLGEALRAWIREHYGDEQPGMPMTSSASFFVLCWNGRVQRVKEELSKGGDVDRLLEKRHGMFLYTPLHAAVVRNQHEVVQVLVKFYYADVNCRSGDGYTPLHLAAQQGYVKCVRHLLSATNVRFGLEDDNGKTAQEAAHDAGNSEVVTIIRSATLVQAIGRNEKRHLIIGLLERMQWTDFESGTLERCLTVCAAKGLLVPASLLLMRSCGGRFDFSRYYRLALANCHFLLAAFLLLFDAASSGNSDAFRFKNGDEAAAVATENASSGDNAKQGSGASRGSSSGQGNRPDKSRVFWQAMAACLANEDARTCLMAVARRRGHVCVVRELLLRTDCNRGARTVKWDGLVLRDMHGTWIEAVSEWVVTFNLSFNYLTTVPQELSQCCSCLTKLYLRGNKLKLIPDELVQIAELGLLDLSANDLAELPDCNWTESLNCLVITQNVLDALPDGLVCCKDNLATLEMAANQFTAVPDVVRFLQNIQILDISHNHPSFSTLPDFLGSLTQLHCLQRAGLTIVQPPRAMSIRSVEHLKTLLRQRLRGCKPYFGMKLMVIGLPAKGKTTLIGKLQGRAATENVSTVGIDVSEWRLPPPPGDARLRDDVQLSVWDFAGQPVYHATHQCFLSRRCVYVLVWSVLDGRAGVEDMRPWLDNVQACARHAPVVVVTTHLDKLLLATSSSSSSSSGRGDGFDRRTAEAEGWLRQLLAECPYDKMDVRVAPLSDDIEHVRLAIFDAVLAFRPGERRPRNHEHRQKLCALGEDIPKCYLDMEQVVRQKRQELRATGEPQVLSVDELRQLIAERNVVGLDHDSELTMAVRFLHENGTLLHYESAADLESVYFIDPQWLSDMISAVVTVRERNPFAYGGQGRAPGVMQRDAIWSILSGRRFPRRYALEYLSLLNFFAVAVFMDSRRLLIPSLLADSPAPTPRLRRRASERRPDAGANAAAADAASLVFQRRYCMQTIPNGLWSRMLARLLCQLGPELQGRGLLADDDDWLAPVSDPRSSNEEQQQPGAAPLSADVADRDRGDDVDDHHIVVWKRGLRFEHAGRLTILIRQLDDANLGSTGIAVTTAGGRETGRHFLALIVNHVDTLLHEWYEHLVDDPVQPMKVDAACPTCSSSSSIDGGDGGRSYFRIQDCKNALHAGKPSVWCRGHRGDVALADVVPELLVQNLPPELFLSATQVQCEPADESSHLGTGGYGKVFRGHADGRRVAVKFYRNRDESLSIYRECSREVSMLHQLKHPNVVQVVGVVVHPLQLVLELAPMGSLRHLLREKKTLPRLLVYSMAAQIAGTLQFLDERSVVFRDLKSDNILVFSKDLEDDVNLKLTDFGQASLCAPYGIKGNGGTPCFQAPELLRRMTYTRKVDMYSFACVLWELLTNSRPFSGKVKHAIFKQVNKGVRPKLDESDGSRMDMPCLESLMNQSWHQSAKLRPVAAAAAAFLRQRPAQLLQRELRPHRDVLPIGHAVRVPSVGALWLVSAEVGGGGGGARRGCHVDVLDEESLRRVATVSLLIPGVEVTHVLAVSQSVWMATRDSATVSIVAANQTTTTTTTTTTTPSSAPSSPLSSSTASSSPSPSSSSPPLLAPRQATALVCACRQHRQDVSGMEHWQGAVLVATVCGCISSLTHRHEHLWSYRLEHGFASSMVRVGTSLWVASKQRIVVLSDHHHRRLVPTTSFLSAHESLLCAGSGTRLKLLGGRMVCSWQLGGDVIRLWNAVNMASSSESSLQQKPSVGSGAPASVHPSLDIDIGRAVADEPGFLVKEAGSAAATAAATSVADVVLAKDCLWVGTAGGRIIIFSADGVLLTWIRAFCGRIVSLVKVVGPPAGENTTTGIESNESILSIGHGAASPQTPVGEQAQEIQEQGDPVVQVKGEDGEEVGRLNVTRVSARFSLSPTRSVATSSAYGRADSVAVQHQSAMLWDVVSADSLRLLHRRSQS